jgi:hypothetical protein
MKGTLVIVPCGQGKVWDADPNRGSVPACDAYNGAPFKVNRAYAEYFADRWVILSAKYGFIPPDFPIPGPYNVTFKKQTTNPVEVSTLRKQIKDRQLDQFEKVVGLGGKEYRAMVEEAFQSLPVKLYFPFAGLPIGKAMQAAKRAIAADKP